MRLVQPEYVYNPGEEKCMERRSINKEYLAAAT
jgi:hypothetical protein